MKNRKLTGPWAGFSFENYALVTPEGRRLLPEDLAWISLTAQLAQEYRRLLDVEKRLAKGLIRRSAEPCPVVPLLPALRRSGRA